MGSVFLVFDSDSDLPLAVFAKLEDALKFEASLDDPYADTVERTVFYGQPPVLGFNL